MCACNQAARSAVVKGQQIVAGKIFKQQSLDADNQVLDCEQAAADATHQLALVKMRLVLSHIQTHLDVRLLVYVSLVH